MAGLGDFINSIQNDSDFPEDQRPISRWHFEVAHQMMKACLTSDRPAAARCAVLHRRRLELRRRLRALVRVMTTVSIVSLFSDTKSGNTGQEDFEREVAAHHAPRRLLVGTGPVGWRPQCPADDDKPSRSLVAATGSHGGMHGRGAGPAGSHRRTDRVAVARNLSRRGFALVSHRAFSATGTGHPSEASIAHCAWRRKVRVADWTSDIYTVRSLLDL